MSARFSPLFRLKKNAEFQAVYQQAKRSGDQALLVFAIPNGLDHSRMGMSVSRKYGCSVRRNRFKRVLREAFRLSLARIPSGMDLVVIPRAGLEPTLEGSQESLVHQTKRLAGKLRLPGPRGDHR